MQRRGVDALSRLQPAKLLTERLLTDTADLTQLSCFQRFGFLSNLVGYHLDLFTEPGFIAIQLGSTRRLELFILEGWKWRRLKRVFPLGSPAHLLAIQLKRGRAHVAA